VSLFARPLPKRPDRRSQVLGRSLLALLLAAVAAFLLAAPAGAVVTTVGPTTVGLAPRYSPEYLESLKPAKFANPGGNPVLHGEHTFAIYWDPTDHYHGDWQQVIDEYFRHAGESSGELGSVFSVATAYTDKSNTPAAYGQTFNGAQTDTKPYPASGCTDPEPFQEEDWIGPLAAGKPTPLCLTSAQVAAEVERYVNANALPKGLGYTYFLLTPPGATICLDAGGPAGHCSDYTGGVKEASYLNSFCSYHADINPGGLASGDANTLLYAVIPWSAGGYGDPLLNRLDRTAGWPCQDDGLNPAGKHGGYEVEKSKVRGSKEQKEFEEKSLEEQEEIEEAAAHEGPHAEEPNQNPQCPNIFDGGCDTGLADMIVSQIGMQQVNMITDPLLNAWQDPARNENVDQCRFLFGPVRGGSVSAGEESIAGTLYDQVLGGGNYYLNDAFNLAARQLPYPDAECIHGVNLIPAFTAPNPVNSGETVGFDGMESDIWLNAATGFDAKGNPTQNYAGYTWNFGDGSAPVSGFAPGAPACETPWLSPCAASVFHSYTYGGTYTVSLTVTDVGGHTATVTHPVTVIGPPPPPAPPGTGTNSGGFAGAGSAANGLTPPVPAPNAVAAVLSHSLRSVSHSGLLVRYAVNEQVAGHFEVLLDRSLAKRLGISGETAVGLPAGWAPQVVIGKALLVTTKAGGSTVHIQFSKRTSQRLARLHKVSLLLRLIVRNASRKPTSATVLSSFTLTR
jgi:hypothetical protein